MRSEVPFTLPLGLLDDEGTTHREGVMRLGGGGDEAALFAAMEGDGRVALDNLQRSLALCQGAIGGRVYEATANVAAERIVLAMIVELASSEIR